MRNGVLPGSRVWARSKQTATRVGCRTAGRGTEWRQAIGWAAGQQKQWQRDRVGLWEGMHRDRAAQNGGLAQVGCRTAGQEGCLAHFQGAPSHVVSVCSVCVCVCVCVCVPHAAGRPARLHTAGTGEPPLFWVATEGTVGHVCRAARANWPQLGSAVRSSPWHARINGA